MTTELVELADRLEAESGRLTNWSSNPNDPNLQPMHDHQTKALLTEAANELRALASRAGGSDAANWTLTGECVRVGWDAEMQSHRLVISTTMHDLLDSPPLIYQKVTVSLTAAPEPVGVGSSNSTNDEESA